MKLYPYQIECIETIEEHFKRNDKQLIQLPTGSGKTVIFLHYIKEFCGRVLVLVPSRDLLYQIERSAQHILGKGQLSLRNGSKHIANTFHSLATAARERFLETRFDHIIIDEAHHSSCESIMSFLEEYHKRNPKTKLLGFTATPERLDGKNLLKIFDSLTYSKNIVNLIDMGFLCDLVGFKFKTGCKLDSRNQARGDFKPVELARLDCESRNALIERAIEEKCKDRKTIIFCLNVKHSIKIASRLKQKGFKSGHIDGNMSDQERQDVISAFRDGDIQYLCNCQILTEGFDEPSIDAVIIARATKSKALYCQMVGRGVRLYPKKENCLVVDLFDDSVNICNFNVAAHSDLYETYDYPQNISIRELSEKLITKNMETLLVPVEDFSLEEHDLLNRNLSVGATEHQLEVLKRENIQYFEPLSMKEAAFLIWYEKLKRSYVSV